MDYDSKPAVFNKKFRLYISRLIDNLKWH